MNFIGHKKQAALLSRHVEKGTIMHGYLFAGIAGLGKTKVARWFMHALLCSRPVSGMACMDCLSCEAYAQGRHPDVITITDSGGAIGLDAIRDLEGSMLLQPILAKRRVVLVEDAALCTPESWNALLKTLEEPRGLNVYVFVTRSTRKIPLTIRSRLALIPFHPLSLSELGQMSESLALEPEALVAAGGRPSYVLAHAEQAAITLEGLMQKLQRDASRADQNDLVRKFCSQERAHLHAALATQQTDAVPFRVGAGRLRVLEQVENLLEKHITPSLLVRLLWFTYRAYPVSLS